MKNGALMRCFYCAEKFSPTSEWQVFCSNKCKDHWNKENFDSCFYCGDIATDRDHILPASSRGPVRRFSGQETVRACRECNVVLGPKIFLSIFDRIDYLIRTYRKRYKLNKPTVHWDEDELEEIGHTLASKIKKDISKRERGENKIVFLRARKLELVSFDDEDDDCI